MEAGDLWFSADKYQHITACFIITVIVAFLSQRIFRHSLLRRRSAAVGSIAALLAGAAKEFADEFGFFWQSSGASYKDAVADIVGILIANLFMARFGLWKRQVELNQDLSSMV